jgi:hypothetical protein
MALIHESAGARTRLLEKNAREIAIDRRFEVVLKPIQRRPR